MSSLDSFVGKAGEAGTRQSEGEFSISSAKQLEKLQGLLLEEPGNFLLKIIQGLVASGAREVRCTLGRLSMRIEATGCKHPRHGLLERFSRKVGGQKDATDDLALGVLGALGLQMSEVAWQLARGESVTMDKYGVQRPSDTNKSNKTTFTFKFPVLSFVESIRIAISIRGSAHQLISCKCCYSPVPIYLGSKRIRPVELCSRYASGGGRVTLKTVTIGMKTSIYPTLTKYSYQYWGRMNVYGTERRDSHCPPEIWGPVQCLADGPPNKASSKRAWYDSFLLAHVQDTPGGLSKLDKPPEDAALVNSLYLLADREAPGGLLTLISKGVEVYHGPQQIGSSRGVAIASAEGLKFDASTLKVVEDESFENKLKEVREQMDLLRNEVMMRSGVVPKEFQLGPGSLY
jgi:hypothetical protein